jgi:hypothetical protein
MSQNAGRNLERQWQRKSLEGARQSGKGKGFMEDRLFPGLNAGSPLGARQIIAYLIDRTSQDCGSYTA